MTKRRMKYNPSFLSEAELIESFVVRHADLELIVGIIGENVTDSNQHVLVIGPRGSGKTTLVHRIAAEIEQNQELRGRWYPLIFSEESYEVVSAGEFWLEALFHLSEQADDEKWKRTYVELKNESDDQRLADRALAQLLDFADSQGKRVLMIVENLNMLFADLTSVDEAWKIRHTLINEPRLMLLATATNRFEHIENTSQAMFEMFKMQELKPLEDDECNQIWEHITGQKLLGERIKPVRILTGGNPRLLTIIANFSAHRSFRKLLDDLVDLIDDHTEYFKSHLDNLPAIERKVYLALAGLWDASTAREIAQAARLDVNKTSSLLGRLINRGAVVVEDHGKKTKWYVVAERMYNIYYLMRRRGKPADRVKATVKFLVSMYDPESAARLISEEACGFSPELRRDHCLAYEAALEEVTDLQLRERIIASTPKEFLESPYLNSSLKTTAVCNEHPTTKEDNNEYEVTAFVAAISLLIQGIECYMKGHYEQSISLFDKVIEQFSSSTENRLLSKVAFAMVGKGEALRQLNRHEEEIATYDDVVGRFADLREAPIREQVATALYHKGITLSSLNRSKEAIPVYDKVVACFADAHETNICEIVAMALVNKAIILSEYNCTEEAIAGFNEVVDRFAGMHELHEKVARALSNKGTLLDKLNRYEEAEQSFRMAIEFAPNSIWNAISLMELLLKMPERLDDALQTAEEIIGKKTEDFELLNSVAWAFYKNSEPVLLPKAEQWATKAVSLSPADSNKHHTLACILSALGKGNEALGPARKYLQDTSLVEKTIEDAIELFVELAASGYAKEALGILVNSEAEKHLEPIVVGLKLYTGEDVKTAPEIKEVAKDVVKRIEERIKLRGK
ncbi:MAG: AAA family ATPase [Desulfuromonadales bacterium]|nr:AAA family ATPase [Desulfuromonadales bacterium]